MGIPNQGWKPNPQRRFRHRAARLAASALIAAAIAEAAAHPAAAAPGTSSAWTPGNPGVVGGYNAASLGYGGRLLDVDGDGSADFLLQAYFSNGWVFTLEPLITGGGSNQVFAQSPPVQAHAPTVGRSGPGSAKPAGFVACFDARDFATADDIVNASGPTDYAGCQAGLTSFGGGGYVGLVFNLPPETRPTNRTTSGNQDYGYLAAQTNGDVLTISSVGIQPYNPTTKVVSRTWGSLRSLYR